MSAPAIVAQAAVRRRFDAGAAGVALSWLATCAVLVAWHLHVGLKLSPDSHTFLRWSDELAATGFDLPAYLAATSNISPTVLYLLPVLLIGALRSVSPHLWQWWFFGLNLALMAATVALLAVTARRLAVRPAVVTALLPLCLLSADFLTWPHFLLSDTLYAALLMANLALAVPTTDAGVATLVVRRVALAALLLCRPASPPALLVLALGPAGVRKLLPAMGGRRFAAMLAGLTVLCTLGYALLMDAVLHGRIDSEVLRYLGQMVHDGVIVHARHDTAVATPDGPADIGLLYLRRLAMFFSPWASSYSVPHLFAHFALAAAIALPTIAAWRAHPSPAPAQQRAAAALLVLLALATGLYHAATVIDFDWRYRGPLIAPLLLLAGLSAESLIRRREQAAMGSTR